MSRRAPDHVSDDPAYDGLRCECKPDRASDIMPRIKPAKGWETFKAVSSGLVLIAFSVVWTIVWVISAEGLLAFLGFAGLLFIYHGVKMIIDAARSEKAMRVLERGFTTIEATVLDRFIKERYDEHRNESYTYHIAVQFNAAGKQVALAAQVGKAVYSAREQDQTLAIRYADADPRIILIQGEAGFQQ